MFWGVRRQFSIGLSHFCNKGTKYNCQGHRALLGNQGLHNHFPLSCPTSNANPRTVANWHLLPLTAWTFLPFTMLSPLIYFLLFCSFFNMLFRCHLLHEALFLFSSRMESFIWNHTALNLYFSYNVHCLSIVVFLLQLPDTFLNHFHPLISVTLHSHFPLTSL